jgi:fibronectin-binding autotransporter adhesin
MMRFLLPLSSVSHFRRQSASCLSAALFLAFVGLSSSSALATNVYWDTNGNSTGATNGTTAAGTWDNNATANWTTSSAGTTTTTTYNTADGGSPTTADVFFSAGSNATGTFTVAIEKSTTISARSITIEEGTLTFDQGAGNGSILSIGAGGITINSGAALTVTGSKLTLNLSAAQTWTNNSSNLFSVGVPVTNGANLLTVAGTGNTTISGVLGNGSGGLTKIDSGTLTLSGANTYTGTTTVSAGTLLVNGNQSSATGAVNVSGTGTLLGGTGTIGGAVTITGPAGITGGTNGTVGTLTLSSNLTFTGSSGNFATYFVDLSGATSDKLAIMGILGLSGNFDRIDFNGTVDGTTTYVLATFGSITGTFNNVVDLPTGYALEYDANQLLLKPIPEPSTWVAAALTLGAIGFSQRRRLRALLKPAA